MKGLVKTATAEITSINAINKLLVGRTIITEKTTADALEYWGNVLGVGALAWCHETPRPSPDHKESNEAEFVDGAWREVWHLPIDDPETAKAKAQDRVRSDADTAYEMPVTASNGEVWNGGADSASMIKNAADMAEFLGLATVAIYDKANAGHELTIQQARTVAAEIGSVYQLKFGAKQAAMAAINAVDLTAHDATAQLEAINYAAFLSAAIAAQTEA